MENLLINEHLSFATRVALCLACLILTVLSGLELREKYVNNKIGNAGFWIALPLFQVSFGSLCAFLWGAVYTYGRVKGYDWTWMLDSWFIGIYTMLIFAGAVGMVYGITRCVKTASLVTLGVIVTWLSAYIWIGL